MSDPAAHVHAELGGQTHLVGRLWIRSGRGRESATFEYEDTWLERHEKFALEPALALGPGPFHTGEGRALFAALGDSAPDRWGRNLMARAERRQAKAEGRAPRALREIDYLLAVSDTTRQGALRFSVDRDGPFLNNSDNAHVPPLVELPALLAASQHVIDDAETDEDIRLLLAPGSSLGGARPKASVRTVDGHLQIAKFPANSDEMDLVLWEGLALSLAREAGIRVPAARIEGVADRNVLLLERFDRRGEWRIPFLSAMSMLGAVDRQTHSYLEIADALRQHGSNTRSDIPELWRRIVFNVLISNTDDHLRNHGFLYEGVDGWRLSPAYDLNPVPADVKPRFLSTSIGLDDDLSASMAIALEVAQEFALSPADARTIARDVGNVVARWREQAARFGIAGPEIERMSSAFEHEDLDLALRG